MGKILEIKALNNGAHRNQMWNNAFKVPEGWAIIPNDMETENFPFGEVEVEEIDDVTTVTKWAALPIPETKPVKEEPTQLDIIEAQIMYTAMMTDTLLEV